MKVGICSVCNTGPKKLAYRDFEDREYICHVCYERIRRHRKDKISGPLRPAKVKVQKVQKPKPAPNSRKKYPDKESVLAAFELRRKLGKKTNPTAVAVEDRSLYRAARRFGVTVPPREEEEPWRFNTALRTQSPQPANQEIDLKQTLPPRKLAAEWEIGDKALCLRELERGSGRQGGKVIRKGDGEVTVKFEYRNIIMSFCQGFNLSQIVPYVEEVPPNEEVYIKGEEKIPALSFTLSEVEGFCA